MVITVFGLGFVGLTTSLGFAEYGHTVYGVEISEGRLDTIRQGKLPFLEPGLDEALTRHLNKRFLPIGIEGLRQCDRATASTIAWARLTARTDRLTSPFYSGPLNRPWRNGHKTAIRCWW